MKRKSLLILGLIAMLGLGVTSCKKDCKCKASYAAGWTDDVSYFDTNTKTKKKDCKDYQETKIDAYGDPELIKFTCTWGN